MDVFCNGGCGDGREEHFVLGRAAWIHLQLLRSRWRVQQVALGGEQLKRLHCDPRLHHRRTMATQGRYSMRSREIEDGNMAPLWRSRMDRQQFHLGSCTAWLHPH